MTSPTKVYVYVHTHWDREWYRTFQQYRFKLIEVIDIILDQLDRNKLQYFTLDGQSIVLNDYIEVKPHNCNRLINYIKEGRIDVGPWYVLPDEFLVSGESLVENLYLGNKISNIFGKVNKVGYIPDTFGHSADIPMILKKFNIDNAIIWRGVKVNKTEFKWYSLDNSWVKTYHLLNGYYANIFDPEEPRTLQEKIDLIKDFTGKIKSNTTLDFILMPVGGDHRPPPLNMSGQIQEINESQSDYELIECTLSQFLNNLNPDNISNILQQELRDCSNAPILPAVFSSRLYLKQHNARLTHNINRIIEPLSCYCNSLKLDQFELPDSEYLWKMLIENHPHDSICGCSVDEVHKEMEQRYVCLHEACNEIINRAKLSIINNIPEGKVAVFNSSNYPLTGAVKLNTCKKISTQIPQQTLRNFEDRHFTAYSNVVLARPATIVMPQTDSLIWAKNIPAHSLTIIEPSEISNPVKYNNGKLSNGLLDITINSDSITITDIHEGIIYENINQIIDRLDCGDSYNFGPVKEDLPIKAKIINHSIIEEGPIRGIIELVYSLEIPESINEDRVSPSDKEISHLIYCNLIITADSKLIEFNLSWENKSKDHILQALFPTERDIYTTLVENHFSAIERSFDPHYNIYEHIPAPEQTELKTNTAPMQRFVQANDIVLFSEGLPEYEVYKNNLYITILRSTGYLSRNDVTTRCFFAGPGLETPDNQCLRINKARYAFHPKTSISELYRIVDQFMGCTECIVGENKNVENYVKPGQLFNWENPNIISTCFKFNRETNGLIIHLLNITSYPQKVFFNTELEIKDIEETNFLKEPVGNVINNMECIFSTHELKCIHIKLK